jgi:preprotein translocase subunit SecD
MRYVVFTPVTRVSSAHINEMVRVLRRRLEGLGIRASDVRAAADGSAVAVGVPAAQRDVLQGLSAVGRLEFREVYQSVASSATSAGSPIRPDVTVTATARPAAVAAGLLAGPAIAADAATATDAPPVAALVRFQTHTCPSSDTEASADQPAAWLVACDREGTTKYLLKPAKVVGTDVKTASAGLQSSGTTSVTTGQWVVNVDFTGSGQTKFTRFTEETIGKQIALVLDGVVQSAPQVNERISGSAQISGGFTELQARDLANVLKYGALPVKVVSSTVTSTIPPGFS